MKTTKKLLLFLAPALALSQSQSPIAITPSQPVAAAGTSILITADRAVKYALSGAGVITAGPTPNTVLYSAPSSFSPQHVLEGCMVTPDDSVFNTRIDNLPLSSSSNQWTPQALIGPLAIDFQWGTNHADDSSPLTPQSFYYTTSLNGTGFPIPALPDKKRETGAYTTDFNNDHHMLVVNHQSCRFYETYQEGNPNSVCPECTAASGWTYSSGSYTLPSAADGGGSTDAASLPLAPLTIHMSEIQSGVIHHALRFTTCAGCIGTQYTWPANHSTGGMPGAAPMGARFRLKAGFDVSNFAPAAQVVLNALKQYGMILADIGMSGHVSASSDVTEDPEVAAALQSIRYANIDSSNFEVVEESSLMLNAGSNLVNSANPYVKPVHQALLTITDAANPANTKTLPIALQAVTVGTPDPDIAVQAGTDPFAIQAWVNGTPNEAVTWSISSSSGGAITPAGIYSAPRTLKAPLRAVLTATSLADSTASTSVTVTVFPQGYTHIDTGSPTSTTDPSGLTWLADFGFETGSFNTVNDNYPANLWGSIDNPIQTQSYMYTWGDDVQYRLHVPNGNYSVILMFGLGNCSGQFGGVFDNGLISGPVHIETQGQIVRHDFDYGMANNHECRTPVSVQVPATVTDTNLSIALRAVGGYNAHSAPILNGVRFGRFWGAPGFTIDHQQQNTIKVGTSTQLYAIPWFVPEGPVQWEILSGPGTIDQTGLYTAPAGLSGGTATVTVQVQSISGSASPGIAKLVVTQ